MSIAHCYSHGKGVDVDLKMAFEYHSMAANKGIHFLHSPTIKLLIEDNSSVFASFLTFFVYLALFYKCCLWHGLLGCNLLIDLWQNCQI